MSTSLFDNNNKKQNT